METIIDELNTGKTTKIVFSINEYKEKRYASIRKHINTKYYQGPTKKGLSLERKSIEKIYIELHNLSLSKYGPGKIGEQKMVVDIGDTSAAHIGLKKFKGKEYIIIQKYYTNGKYSGPGHGFGFPYKDIDKVASILKKIIEKWDIKLEKEPNQNNNDKVFVDMWKLHRDTRKIAKIMGLDLKIVREKLIKLDLI